MEDVNRQEILINYGLKSNSIKILKWAEKENTKYAQSRRKSLKLKKPFKELYNKKEIKWDKNYK